MIELMVVIGIILVLIGLLLPTINKAYKDSIRNSMTADLQIISQALEAYKSDFGDYPRMTPGPQAKSGAALLCWALVGPGPSTGTGFDGADGPGFRLRGTQGKVYGPYLPPDRFKIGLPVNGSVQAAASVAGTYDDTQDVLADRNGHPILYFPAAGGISPSQAFVGQYTPGTLPPTAIFNYNDDSDPSTLLGSSNTLLTANMMSWRLGDTGSGSGNATPDGKIEPTESAVTTGPFLLWSAGPDEAFGTDDDVIADGHGAQINGPLPGNFTP